MAPRYDEEELKLTQTFRNRFQAVVEEGL